MQIKIYPASVNNQTMKGWILVDVPPHDERVELYRGFGLKIQNGEVVQNDDIVVQAQAMTKIAKDRIVDAEIEFEGTIYKKDDLFIWNDFQEAWMEAANLCLKGPTLSKKL